jgi:hypothetical protein
VVDRLIMAGRWRPGDADVLVVFDAGYDLAGAENAVHAGQAAFWYSWRSPPSQSCRRTCRRVSVVGSVIGEAKSR